MLGTTLFTSLEIPAWFFDYDDFKETIQQQLIKDGY